MHKVIKNLMHYDYRVTWGRDKTLDGGRLTASVSCGMSLVGDRQLKDITLALVAEAPSV